MNFRHLLEPVPASDWLVILVLFAGIACLIALSELIRKQFRWSQEFTRKLVHISVGLLMFFAPVLLHSSLPMVLIALFFIFVNGFALHKGLLKGMHGERHSYGTVYYPLSFLLLVLFAWPEHKFLIVAPMMVLALADAAAAIVGESLPRVHSYVLISEQKSVEGSTAMFLMTVAVLFPLLFFYPLQGSAAGALWISVLTAAVATVAEALSSKGSDNLSVPLISALFLYFMTTHTITHNVQLSIGVFLGAVVAFASYRLNLLTRSGAAATFLLASVIFGFGGWQWTIPILTFFILSSILSRSGRSLKTQLELIFEKGSRRDYAQVFANGGIAGALMILFMFNNKPIVYLYYLGALAAATADTWATEIGVLARQQPRLIVNLHPVEMGTSGGITPAGLLGAFLGALVLSLSGWQFLFQELPHWNLLVLIFLVTISGFMASLVDSYIGATIQAQYRCPVCQKRTEKKFHCNGESTLQISGFSWITNDTVNLFNTVSALIFIAVGHTLLTWNLS